MESEEGKSEWKWSKEKTLREKEKEKRKVRESLWQPCSLHEVKDRCDARRVIQWPGCQNTSSGNSNRTNPSHENCEKSQKLREKMGKSQYFF